MPSHKEGMMLLNFAPETQCTPIGSALMTGRHSVRSGNQSVSPTGAHCGLVRWERTLGDIFSEAGYATSIVGKWQIGDSKGRWPTNHGFDEWYGIPRSHDECLWAADPCDTDPREREPYNNPYVHTWVLAHTAKLVVDYQKSLIREPLIPFGAPLDYLPKQKP
ncbi:MAG TPA: sulfatase-like hydrolase/transferase [Terriglobales bacterium]